MDPARRFWDSEVAFGIQRSLSGLGAEVALGSIRKQLGEDGLSVTIRYAGLLTGWDNMPQPPPTWGRTRRELH